MLIKQQIYCMLIIQRTNLYHMTLITTLNILEQLINALIKLICCVTTLSCYAACNTRM